MGEQVAEYANTIFATGREMMEMIKGRPVGRPLELRVGIREVMPKLVAFPAASTGTRTGPTLRLICHEGEMSELIADLAIHKLDVVLTDTPLDSLYRVQAHSHRLGSSKRDYRRGQKVGRSLSPQLPFIAGRRSFLAAHRGERTAPTFDRWFNDLGLTPVIRGEFADSAMIKIAGRTGLGLFAVPSIIEEEVKKLYACSAWASPAASKNTSMPSQSNARSNIQAFWLFADTR